MLVVGLTGGIATGKSTVSRLLSSPTSSASSSRITLLDADVLARDVIAPGTSGYDAIVRAFGTKEDLELWREQRVQRTRLAGGAQDVTDDAAVGDWPAGSRLLRPDGITLDRAYIASLVFVKDGSDPAAKQRLRTLNGIVHPRVRRALLWGVIRSWWKGQAACVLDVPLLIEAGLDRFCGEVVVVYVNPETQLERLLKRPDPNTNASSSSSAPPATLTPDQARSRIAAQLPLDTKLQRADVVLDNSGDLAALEPQVARLVSRWIAEDDRLWVRIWRTAGRWCPPLALWSALWTLTVRRLRSRREMTASEERRGQ